jgi:hypothetical protein
VERARLAWVQWQDGQQQQARETLRLAVADSVLLGRDSDYLDWVRSQIDPEDELSAPDEPGVEEEVSTSETPAD